MPQVAFLLALALLVAACNVVRSPAYGDDDDDSAAADDDDATDDDDTAPPAQSCSTYAPSSDDSLYAIQAGDTVGSVSVEGVVVTAVRDLGVWVMEPGGGSCSGLWVYTGEGHGLSRGRLIDVSGVTEEYYELTEINALEGTVTNVGSGSVPAAELLALSELQAPGAEDWEGVLVEVQDVDVTVPPSSATEDEWTVSDELNTLIIDDQIYDIGDDQTLTVGQNFSSITGICNYTFEVYKLTPRDPADIDE
ncbi:MAG: hypothetical protein GY898_03125 [Proteobacteria bacterium]|nr:hypothetical protein [Pseudomonadota bacterium]